MKEKYMATKELFGGGGGGFKLELLAPKLNVSEKKKRKQRTVISLLKNGPKAWTT